MTCESSFDRYIALDKNDRVPLAVTLHLLVCPTCRTCIRQMTRAERVLAAPLAVRPIPAAVPSDPVVAAALRRIKEAGLGYPQVEPNIRHVSFLRWIITGLALATGFTVLPFSFMGEWSSATFGMSFYLPFYLLCGIAVTVYCGLFVGSNIDLFIKKFGMHHTAG